MRAGQSVAAKWALLIALTCAACDDGPRRERRGDHLSRPTDGGTVQLAAIGDRCVDPPHDDDPPPSNDVLRSEPGDGALRELAARGTPLTIAASGHVLRVELPVNASAIRTSGGRYAVVELDGLRIHVINRGSPRTRAEPADLVLDVGDADIASAAVIVSLERTATGVQLRSVRAGQAQIGPTTLASVAVDGCTARAWASITAPLPVGLPAMRFPPVNGPCNETQCAMIRAAWIRGFVALYLTRQSIEYLAGLHPEQRLYAWDRPGRNASGSLTSPMHAPSYYFGPYDSTRYADIRMAISKLWSVYRDLQTGTGIPLRHRCPPTSDFGNLCFTTNTVVANHIVIGQINFCNRFFGYTEWERASIAMHEATHHIQVGHRILRDQWVHGHGPTCLANLEGGSILGHEAVHHLATYRNSNGGDCDHPNIATRTVDAYAEFIRNHGSARWDGSITTWPAWGDPTPQPPQNCTAGDPGCTCDTLWASGDNRYPDGDSSVSEVCPDHEGETVCARTSFGATSVGICTVCEGTERANGCTCEDHDQCASHHCWGTDTQNGYGVGRCYDASPPSWVCLADCKTLFADDGAWCDANYLGGARCMDSGCSAPQAEACRIDNLVCIDGECVVECDSNDDCAALGYPETFICQNNGCQRQDGL